MIDTSLTELCPRCERNRFTPYAMRDFTGAGPIPPDEWPIP